MSDLEARLLAAHAADDRKTLISLYVEASESTSDAIESGFFLTHAYVFALEAADPRIDALATRLKQTGRL